MKNKFKEIMKIKEITKLYNKIYTNKLEAKQKILEDTLHLNVNSKEMLINYFLKEIK